MVLQCETTDKNEMYPLSLNSLQAMSKVKRNHGGKLIIFSSPGRSHFLCIPARYSKSKARSREPFSVSRTLCLIQNIRNAKSDPLSCLSL